MLRCRKHLEDMWEAVLPNAMDGDEVVMWTRVWQQWDASRFDLTTYRLDLPAALPSVFFSHTRSVAQVMARFVARNCALFSPYYRPFVQEVWSVCKVLPIPRSKVSLD